MILSPTQSPISPPHAAVPRADLGARQAAEGHAYLEAGKSTGKVLYRI